MHSEYRQKLSWEMGLNTHYEMHYTLYPLSRISLQAGAVTSL